MDEDDAGKKTADQDYNAQLEEIKKTLDDLLATKDETIIADIAMIYPKFRPENYERAPKIDSAEYERLDPHSTVLKKGDIIIASTSAITISGHWLEEECKFYEDYLKSEDSGTKLNRYLQIANRVTQHIFNKLKLEKGLETNCCNVYDSMVAGRLVPLADILMGTAPTVCFGQAVCLAFLINSDAHLYSCGFRAYVTVGDLAKQNEKTGYHAWVKLYLEDSSSCPKNKPIKLMDATASRMLCLDEKGLIDSPDGKTKGLYTEINRSSFYILRRKQ